MKIEYIPPRKGTYSITIPYWDHKKLFEDVGSRGPQWGFVPPVLSWFEANDPEAKWNFDCGDFGDGHPIAIVKFTSLDAAEGFVAEFTGAAP